MSASLATASTNCRNLVWLERNRRERFNAHWWKRRGRASRKAASPKPPAELPHRSEGIFTSSPRDLGAPACVPYNGKCSLQEEMSQQKERKM